MNEVYYRCFLSNGCNLVSESTCTSCFPPSLGTVWASGGRTLPWPCSKTQSWLTGLSRRGGRRGAVFQWGGERRGRNDGRVRWCSTVSCWQLHVHVLLSELRVYKKIVLQFFFLAKTTHVHTRCTHNTHTHTHTLVTFPRRSSMSPKMNAVLSGECN